MSFCWWRLMGMSFDHLKLKWTTDQPAWPQGQQTRPQAQPARFQGQSARPHGQPFRPQGQKARPQGQPARSQVQLPRSPSQPSGPQRQSVRPDRPWTDIWMYRISPHARWLSSPICPTSKDLRHRLYKANSVSTSTRWKRIFPTYDNIWHCWKLTWHLRNKTRHLYYLIKNSTYTWSIS